MRTTECHSLVMEFIVKNMIRRNIAEAAIVSHGGLLRAFLKQKFPEDEIKLGNCEPVILNYDTDAKHWQLSD